MPELADGGHFGTWSKDEFGMPAYLYLLDQFANPLGTWNTELFPEGASPDSPAELDLSIPVAGLRPDPVAGRSNVHWHQLGNDRYTAVHTNDGWTQLYSHEFGPRWINRCDLSAGFYAGGVSYLCLDGQVIPTLYGGRPDGASVVRSFGCSYGRYRVSFGDAFLERTVFAPFGDSPFLVAMVRITNTSQRPRSISHLEYWDLNVEDLGYPGAQPWRVSDRWRRARSGLLYDGYAAGWEDDLHSVVARHPWAGIIGADQDWPGSTQRVRPDVAMVVLEGLVGRPITDRKELFADGNPYRPSLLAGSPGPDRSDLSQAQHQKPVLAFLSAHDLEPAETVTLGFAYGACAPWETIDDVGAIASSPVERTFRATMSAWSDYLPRLSLGDPAIEREAMWSAYYLRSGAVSHRAFDAHTLPQGGAYQYLAGVNAGPRATLQHALPLIWLAPELAKEAIRFTCSETHPGGEIPYAEVGNGSLDAMRYIPSDHDLWLLWAVSEYVLATRDRRFLSELRSYWPGSHTRPESVWEHCLRALEHLLTTIGFGSHGLLRMRTSDWNDAVVRESGIPIDQVWSEGESTLNSAMAVHVLRRFAELARYQHNQAAADRAGDGAEHLAVAIQSCWRGSQVNRGWLTATEEVGWKDLFLEPQPWALISSVLDPAQEQTLVETISERLADPLGARIFASGGEGRVPTAGGGQWLSINSTLVWGLSKVSPTAAWKELRANSLANHASQYPATWFGIWSGPDTYLPSSASRPGETWSWQGVFAMQAWPVQILFAHSELLNSLIWMMGVEPTARALRITPRLPMTRWRWSSANLELDYTERRIAGSVTASGAELYTLEIEPCVEWHNLRVQVTDSSGVREETIRSGQFISISLAIDGHQAARFEVVLAQ